LLPLEMAGAVLAFCFLALFGGYGNGKLVEATGMPTEGAAR
jgi:hypothetical protein